MSAKPNAIAIVNTGIESRQNPRKRILSDDSVDIVVEVMGGDQPAFDYIKRAMENGKSVVTANKEVIAKHGKELKKIAVNADKQLLFEASVGGGIPIIQP